MSSLTLNRRRFLLAAAGGLAAGGGMYAYGRGVRFPLLHLTGNGPVTASSEDGIEVSAQGALFQEARRNVFRFRAFVPEPVFAARGGDARIIVENVHPEAALEVDQPGAAGRPVSENRTGLTRSVAIESAAEGAGLAWRFPRPEQYRFAAIGDSGGGAELRWVLKRAAQLGADFLIHLGDFYYEQGDFDRAAVNLNAADIPTYAAIGNHDFHKAWRALYPRFHRVVGPSNSVFRLGGVEFVNIDTAADFIPAASGRRGRLIETLQPVDASSVISERVVFTHKPLRDPDPERDHAVDRAAEAQWLRDSLLASGARTLLTGHIHIKAELDDQGLYTYVTGQGLGHADLIGDKPYRRYAEILVGDVERGASVRYQWRPLNMPFEAHCNARNLQVLDAVGRPDVKARLMEQCGKG